MRGVVPTTPLAMGGAGTHGLSKWAWADDETQRTQLVKVAVLRVFDADADGEQVEVDRVARVFGVDGNEFVVLQERTGVAEWRWHPSGSDGKGYIVFADGTRWELGGGGCGCGHPLKRLHPTRSRIKES